MTTKREFPEEENMTAFRETPGKACEGMQRKYIGCTEKERERPKSYEGKGGINTQVIEETITNPFTKETRTIKTLVEIPVEEVIEETIKNLKYKLVIGTITAEEREILKLLIG